MLKEKRRENNQVTVLNMEKLFFNVKYIIPIYQRNYAWGSDEIQQLISDIISSEGTYYLGNLIVNQVGNGEFEVVDGQQRLTTLFLLMIYLDDARGNQLNYSSLVFESRKKSNDTFLELCRNKNDLSFSSNVFSEEILNGYNIIKNYFDSTKIEVESFKNKLFENIRLLRVQVPAKIDLNHYFEIMNTRGEQLEDHEIAKERFLENLSDQKHREAGAIVWDACADMSSYIQMKFLPSCREAIFGEKWDGFCVKDFEEVVEIISEHYNLAESNEDESSLEDKAKLSLDEIINQLPQKNESSKDKKENDENERFESIIKFPNFILQVNNVLDYEESDQESSDYENKLDDKHFLEKLDEQFKNPEQFLFYLLKCRFLFDTYIIKREYAREYKQEGKWSLQKLQKYRDENSKNNKPKYNATLGCVGEDDSESNKKLRMLQSCLRITYTSPKTMHWITIVLSNLIQSDCKCDLINLLENYCRKKVKNSDYKNMSGFGIERIVFTYLDYLLYWLNNKGEIDISGINMSSWQFQFRSSIEHFHPQHSDNAIIWEDEILNCFGNLALITVSGNSKFSNAEPRSKATYENIVQQSMKLAIMADLANDELGWTREKARTHGREMMKILDDDTAFVDK